MAVVAHSHPAPSRTDRQRRGLLAKVHLARKMLGLEDEDYRATLRRITRQPSAKKCTIAQLQDVVAEFERQGFTASVRPDAKPRKTPPRADHPAARKARAMWLSLYNLGVIRNPSEKALEAFAARQLKCERMAWMRQSECFRLIEALKAMAERNGWPQRGPHGETLRVEQLQEGLCEAILNRLKKVGAAQQDMTITSAVYNFGGLRYGRDPIDWSRAAVAMGEWMRSNGFARPEEMPS
ncbi:MAG: hypothetical protein COC10_05635 [Sphingobium sp.]|jgi:hypothetical protein|nr:MAG: hypothetical protein COC10_05635 [Sphingobium sp.]